jgi:hypothetical protein
MGDHMDLDQFVAARRLPGKACPVCELPERPEIEEGHAKGYSQVSILKWLHHKGYDKLSRWALNLHLTGQCAGVKHG